MNSVNFINFSANITPDSKRQVTFGSKSEVTEKTPVTSLSDVTPAMKAVNISSEKADIKNFANVISKYTYGKKSLIDNPENFKITSNNGNIILHGFHNQDSLSKEGICEELTYKAGIELQEKFGDKYIFIPTKGICSKYNMQHYYISAVKRNSLNEAKVKTLIDGYSELSSKSQDLINNQKYSDDNFNLMEEKAKELSKLSEDVLKGAILIDPSLGEIQPYPETGNVKGYKNELLCDFDTMNPFNNESYVIPAYAAEYGYCVPLGFASEIAPDLNLDSDSLLFLEIMPYDDEVDLDIKSTAPFQFEFDYVDLPENHKLSKFLESLTQ